MVMVSGFGRIPGGGNAGAPPPGRAAWLRVMLDVIPYRHRRDDRPVRFRKTTEKINFPARPGETGIFVPGVPFADTWFAPHAEFGIRSSEFGVRSSE